MIDFERQIEPIIKERCLECHSQDKRKGGLSLATYADALDGGRNGPAIRPGNAARSILIHRVTGAVEPQMPKDEDPLTPREVALIRLWINQGARRTPTSARAPQPWEAPLALTKPVLPAAVWPDWNAPTSRIWIEARGEGAVYSPDGMRIQFDDGRVWQREVAPPPVVVRRAPVVYGR